MTKTPYEVRLDILKMAQDMLALEISLQENERDRKIKREDFSPEPAPKMYSSEELVSRASALYSFVNNTK